jgi:hypothetical protein
MRGLMGMIGRRDPGLEAERTPPRSRETTRRTAAAIGFRVPDRQQRSRTLGDSGRTSPDGFGAAPLRQAAVSTRARSKANPARPYICRLTVFNRFTCPSTGPLLHLCVTAACTAASS